MTRHVIRMHHPANPLAKVIDTAGGVTIGEALERASEGLASIRAESMSALDVKIAEIGALTSAEQFRAAEPDIDHVYALANEILNEAGAFGLTELSEAGRSLCELIGKRKTGAVLDERAVRVHADAMRALREPDASGDADIRVSVLRGLRQLTARAGNR